MYVKLEILREYVVFARHLNFSSTAKELYVSQSGLSTHIKNMEKELGFDLVDRSEPVALTPAGREFLQCAQDTLAAYDAGYRRSLKALASPPARILAYETSERVRDALRRVEDVPFELRTDFKGIDIFSALTAGDVDIILCFDIGIVDELASKAAATGLASFPFDSGRLGMAVGSNHPLAKAGGLSKRDLRNVPIALTDAAYYDYWCPVVRALLGDAQGLSFRLSPRASLASLSFEDLGDMLYVCSIDAIEQSMRMRDDVVVFDELDGRAVELVDAIYYRKDESNENVLAVLAAMRGAALAPQVEHGEEAPPRSSVHDLTS